MEDKEFNLIDERWIPVIFSDGHFEEVSLWTAFEEAHRIRAISGDVPPQDAVIVRLMLAALYCTYSRRSPDGAEAAMIDEQDALDRWSRLWSEGRFDMEVLGRYLSEYRDRFYLFHPDRPFFQARIDKGTEYNAAKLNGALSESANKPRLFTTVSGNEKDSMGYPEATRWLLYVNAFDDTSSKPSVRGQNMPSPGCGWVGKLGFVMIVGDNLFETLMLNLVMTSEDGSPFPDGPAAWETETVNISERVEVPLPASPQEMLTLQDRRLLLRRQNGRVTGYLLLGGDVVDKENAITEQMTMWAVTKDNTLTPKRHDPARAMWRDFSSILMRSGGRQAGIREPGVVRWTSKLIDEGILDIGMVNIRATGVKYGDKDFFVDDLINDSISVNSAILSEMSEALNDRIDRTVAKTDECVRILGWLASDLAKLNGLDDGRGKKEAEKARAKGYAMLDLPFRKWLSSFDPSSDDCETLFNSWDAEMEGILLAAGKGMVDDAGTKALIGLLDKDKKISNGFTVFRLFRIRLHKKVHGEKK